MSKKTMQRLDVMRAYQSSMIHLCDSVLGLRLPLAQAMTSCPDKTMRKVFQTCATMLKSSPTSSVAAVWKQGFEGASEMEGLTRNDLDIINDGGHAIETLCANPTAAQANLYLKRLADHLCILEAEKQKKCKLFHTSGVLAGLMIALLVI
jgi:stage III sporulation protein AB